MATTGTLGAPFHTAPRLRLPMRPKLVLAYLAAVAFMALFLSAGLWQLRRAAEKETLFQAWAQVDQQPLLSWAEAAAQPVARERLLRTTVQGHYISGRNILLDNQQRPGQLGVQVYTPFEVEASGQWLLVARGFMPIARDRSSFPDPPVPAGRMQIDGLLTSPPAAGLKLGQPGAASWPLLVTAIEPAALAQQLGQPLLASVLLLDPQAPEGFVRDWSPNTLSPDRHRGYAVQWLGLALTVLIVTVLLTLRMLRSKPRPSP